MKELQRLWKYVEHENQLLCFQAVWVPDLSSSAGLICCCRNSEKFPSESRSSLLAGRLTLPLTVLSLFGVDRTLNTIILSHRCMSVYRPVCQFFRALVQPEYSAVTDVYVLMFLADTVDFIVIVFGFWAFGVKLVSLTMFTNNISIWAETLLAFIWF